MKTKTETFTQMTISLNPRLFEWLRDFKIVEYLDDELIPLQRWIRFTQIELFNYMTYGYWDGEFEQSDWGDVEKDVARELILELYHLTIPDNVDYIKLEMEN